jgi:guanosine-3',5'-bis(diphosphate) 3'-pyrophosphohydrolase
LEVAAPASETSTPQSSPSCTTRSTRATPTAEDAEIRFGRPIAALIVELSDDKSLPKPVGKDLQVANAHRRSQAAPTAKLTDRISIPRAIAFSPPPRPDARKRAYFERAMNVVAACRTNPPGY